MECPRCGFGDAAGEACARCGVVFAKLRGARPPRLSAPVPAPPARASRGTAAIFWALGLTLTAIAGGVGWQALHPRVSPVPRPAPVAGDVLDREQPAGELPAPPIVSAPEVVIPTFDPAGEPGGDWTAADRTAQQGLAQRLQRKGETIDQRDQAVVEDLLKRHPEDPGLRRMQAAVWLRLGAREQAARRYTEAEQYFRRAAAYPETVGAAQLALLGLFQETGSWSQAEAAAREVLAGDPANLEGQRGLAYALFRQDRNREAAEVLEALLATRQDPPARELLQRIRKTGGDEQGMTERRLTRFHVRYDGETQDEVGREILRALERHYATLTLAFDHSIDSPIPVILFSRESYYAANGVPAWSGGHYDNTDGRIRIPIGGLTSSLTPDLDGTLIHELTHAFVADISRGQAPRELHEGLAQYMEGERIEARLTPAQLSLLARGQAGGVGGFYLQALAFVEYLMQRRGQAGMNELLVTLGSTASLDQACEQAYGANYRRTQQAWREALFRQHGYAAPEGSTLQ